jgi:hypothetical protein
MGRTAGFHPDKTLRQLGEEGQHVLAPQRLGNDHPPRSVNAMNLKNMLGQIEAKSRDRRQIESGFGFVVKSQSTALVNPDFSFGLVSRRESAVRIIVLAIREQLGTTKLRQKAC